jgi:hypothetical protein
LVIFGYRDVCHFFIFAEKDTISAQYALKENVVMYRYDYSRPKEVDQTSKSRGSGGAPFQVYPTASKFIVWLGTWFMQVFSFQGGLDGSHARSDTLKRLIKDCVYFLAFGLGAFIVLIIGVRSAINHDSLFESVVRLKRVFIPSLSEVDETNNYGQIIKDSSKIEVRAPSLTEKSIVAFVFGQSNSANSVGERYMAATNNVVSYFDGHYYLGSDPLLGATGNAGSMWIITANKLIEKNIADKVVLLAAGVGGSSIKLWRTGGSLNKMFEDRLKDATENQIHITHFLFHQGEADNRMSGREYTSGLLELIDLTRQYYPNSKFFVSQASVCRNESSAEILKSQREATRIHNVYLGPNTDLISLNDRYDGCHFSGRGAETASDEWVKLIKFPQKSN